LSMLKKWDGKRLKKLQEDQGLSMQTISEAVSVNTSALFRLRRNGGGTNRSCEKILDIIEKHGINYNVISQEDILMIYQLLQRMKTYIKKTDDETNALLTLSMVRVEKLFKKS